MAEYPVTLSVTEYPLNTVELERLSNGITCTYSIRYIKVKKKKIAKIAQLEAKIEWTI